MRIFVNGEEREAGAGGSLSQLLLELSVPKERIAVELNRTVVRKREWDSTEVKEGDSIEIVHFVGGG